MASAHAGGTQLTQAAQAAGADVPDYDADEDDPDSPDAWADDHEDDIATSVQGHTGPMLSAILLLGGSGDDMTTSTNTLYDQWTGQTGNGDYAGQLAGDLTVLGWGMGEQWGAEQISADGAWSTQKTWNTMGDDRVRATHDDVDGETVDGADSFTVGGEDLDYPQDPAGSDAETAGCRCWLTWTLINNQTGEMEDIAAPDGEE